MIRRMIFVLLMEKLIQMYSLGLLQTEALLGVLWLAMTAIVAGFITWQLTQIIANRELDAV